MTIRLKGESTIVGFGTFESLQEAGRSMRVRIVHVWDTDDGKVVQFEQFTDTKLVSAVIA